MIRPLYTEQMSGTESPCVNYDSESIVEVTIDEIDYRVDSGKDGTALCVSCRPSGSWDWTFAGEAKWDLTMLRCKSLHRSICEQISGALREVA